MYNILKSVLDILLPSKVRWKIEPYLRGIYARIFFKGTAHQCNICNHQFSQFITVQSGDQICPYCGSLPRSRRLWKLLVEENLLKGRVLHFSPSRSLQQRLKEHPGIHYISSDYAGEFLADHQFDITSIDLPNQNIDLIICFHVLEHIEADHEAMQELYRILKPKGRIILQTPFKSGDIYENQAIQTPEERLLHFGQSDHVRIYSVDGLKSRLEKVGFRVDIRRFSGETDGGKFGFKKEESILIGSMISSLSLST